MTIKHHASVPARTAAASRRTVTVSRMALDAAQEVEHLFVEVVSALPYYNDLAKASEIAKYSATELRRLVKDDLDAVLVAHSGSRLVGFCISRLDDGVVWLSWFGVLASARQRGVGPALLRALEETLRQGRSHKLWCDCRTSNEASIAVLTKQGYSQLCTVRNHWYGQDFILWDKLVR